MLKIRLAKNTKHKPWQGINLSKDATCNVICLAKPAKVLKAIFPDNVTKIKNPIQLAEDWPKNHLIKDTICKAIHQAEDAISKAINLAKDTQGNALDKHTNTR